MPEIPMASLSRATLSPDVSVRGVVTLVWPYSASSQTFAVQLATEDFRLRRQHGQVRVTFRGPAASAVAPVAGIADKLVLSLDGAEFVEEDGEGVHGKLSYIRRLRLCVEPVEGQDTVIEVDQPDWQPAEGPILATPTRTVSALSQSVSYGNLRASAYHSPGVQRAIQSSPIVADPFLDDDLDADIPRKRARISFGDVKNWHFTTKSPSPEDAEEANTEQVLETPAAATTTTMQPPQLPLLRMPAVTAAPTTPRLEPVSATTLPLPSPFPDEAMQSPFPAAVSSTSLAVKQGNGTNGNQAALLDITPQHNNTAGTSTSPADLEVHAVIKPKSDSSMKQTLSSLFGFHSGASTEQLPKTPPRPHISAFDIAASPSIATQPDDEGSSEEQSTPTSQIRESEGRIATLAEIVSESPTSAASSRGAGQEVSAQSDIRPPSEQTHLSGLTRDPVHGEEERQARAELVLDIEDISSSSYAESNVQAERASEAASNLTRDMSADASTQEEQLVLPQSAQHPADRTQLQNETSAHQSLSAKIPTRQELAARLRKRRSEIPEGMLKWSAPRMSLESQRSTNAFGTPKMSTSRDNAMERYAVSVKAVKRIRHSEGDQTRQTGERLAQHKRLSVNDTASYVDRVQVLTTIPSVQRATTPPAKAVKQTSRTPVQSLPKQLSTAPQTTSPGFRTACSYFTRLGALDRFVNIASQAHLANQIDILAVIASDPMPVKRQEKQPREYYTVFSVADQSLIPGSGIQVELYCPLRRYIPAAKRGDVILLRAVTVRCRERSPYVKTTKESAWHVFGLEPSISQGDLHCLPVEYGNEEFREALELQTWYSSVAGTTDEVQSQSLQASPLAMAVT